MGSDLYALDPRDFISERDRRVKELRAAGDKESARSVGALRRPTVPAWALNQVARTSAALIDELVDATGVARQAQDKVMAGAGGDVLRGALARRRAAAAAVTGRARDVLTASGRSPDAHERTIELFLADAMNGDEPPAALVSGLLTDLEPSATGSDDLLASLAASMPAGPSAAKRGARRGQPTRSTARLHLVKDEPPPAAPSSPAPLELAEAARRERQDDAAAAEVAVAAAAARVEAAKAAAEVAAAELRTAESALQHDAREHERATSRLAEAERLVADLGDNSSS